MRRGKTRTLAGQQANDGFLREHEGMNVFLSYATEDRAIAEEISLAILGAGHKVFFDKDKLPPAGDYHRTLREAVRTADAFVFLVSPYSVEPGTYALTELKLAREQWPHPKDRVLPVLVRPTPRETVPVYLRAVTVLEPEGSISAEVASAVQALARGSTTGFETVKNTDNELILVTDTATAFASVRSAIERLGRVSETDEKRRVVEGRVRFGLQSVRVRASIAEEEPHRTRVVIQASSDDVWGAGAKSATRRVMETLRNLNTPGYQPDRLGIHPAALAGVLIGFTLVLLTVLSYVLPRLFSFLGI